MEGEQSPDMSQNMNWQTGLVRGEDPIERFAAEECSKKKGFAQNDRELKRSKGKCYIINTHCKQIFPFVF